MDAGVVFVRDLAVILLSAAAAGWLARRLGLSAVVGYLCAGLVVGTPEITLVYVTDPVRVQILAQVGLVLLMFSIGLGVRLKDLRALGLAPILATVVAASLIFTLVRLTGSLAGMEATEKLFFAGMLMVSSSAIIGKVLRETNRLHERAGRLALSQTLLEDFVAVVLLTILGSLVAFENPEAGGWTGVLRGLGQLGAFVLLFLLSGLLLLPRVIRRVSSEAGEELHTIVVAALLFGLAFLTVQAGYSLALGAFLCGVLVAEVPRAQVTERAFSGLRDIFTAVFFVAVGMAIDLRQTVDALPLIALGTGLALVGRFLASAVAWLLVCEGERSALQAALFVTPIGEFSFIIAGLGVTTGVLPEHYQIVAVGIAFLTSLLGPFAMRHHDRIVRGAAALAGRSLPEALEAYRVFWHTVARRGGSHLLWRFLKPRLAQIAREVGWVSAVMLFGQPLYAYLQQGVDESSAAFPWVRLGLPWFWLVLLLLALPALVALVRNLDALCMILADYSRRQSALLARFHDLNVRLLRFLAWAVTAFWFFHLLPWRHVDLWVTLALAVTAVAVTVLGWRRFIRWHGALEVELNAILAGTSPDALARPEWDVARREWGLQLHEVVVAEDSPVAGQNLARLRLRERTGATVVGIQRQGFALQQPGPQTHLFPNDTVLLLGRKEELAAASALLREASTGPADPSAIHRTVLAAIAVTAASPLCGRTLALLQWPRLRGIQVAATRRDGVETTPPGAHWELRAGDELLLVGPEEALRELHRELEGPPPAPPA